MEEELQSQHPHNLIASNYMKECDELVRLCVAKKKLNFNVFRSIWLENNMGSLNKGTTGPQAAMLAQLMLYIGKQYFIKDTPNFKETMVGAYLVFVFLSLQPDKRIAFMKIHESDILKIKRIKFWALLKRKHEILYILNKIISDVPKGYEEALQEYGIVDSTWHYDSTPIADLEDELYYLARKFDEAKRARSRLRRGKPLKRQTFT